MRTVRTLALPLLLGTVWAASVQRSDAQGIKVSDYRSLVSISNVRWSPDGQQLAFVESAGDFANDATVSKLAVVNRSGADLRLITDGKKGVSSPAWSPRGDRIAFICQGANKQDQVFELGANGHGLHQITHCKNGVQNFSWSPSGDRIAFVTPDDDPNEAAIARHDDLFDIEDDGYLISHASVPSHLWVIAAKGGVARRLTQGSWSVLENVAPFIGGPSDPSWSPDGGAITFTRQANSHASDSDQTQIAVVDVATGKVSELTDATSYEYQPQFSTTSHAIAYLRPHGPTALSIMDVFSTSVKSENADLTSNLDRDITSLSWIPGRDELMMLGNEGVQAKIWLRKSTGETAALPLGDLSPYEFSVAKDGAVAFVASTASTPPEVFVCGNAAAAPERITNFNARLRELKYARSEEMKWTAPDGELCDGVLTYPLGYVDGKKYPLVVFSHGGPEAAALAQYSLLESTNLRQPLAADGYFVFEPNYRGSDNLGNHHEHAIYKDPGEGPASDVMSGIAALESLGHIDPARISVAGHSYGGYMTGWLITHDHRWRCAVVADGAFDWKDTYNLTAVGNMAWARDSLGGTPWDPESAELYRTGSPITYAGSVTTPTLILSGTADDTVPITESFALYHALRSKNVPVRFVGIPGAHHTPDDPVRYERFGQLMEDWILQHDR